MLIGATLQIDEINYWEPKIPRNDWMRVFPNSDGLIPVVSDERFAYANRVGMRTIFVSSKVHGKYTGTDAEGFEIVKQRLISLVNTGWFDFVYYTEHHEPEGDYATPQDFKDVFNTALAMVNSLPTAIRAKVKCGPVLTRQWTEKAGENRNYSTHDPGTGDFFGVDMYGNSWSISDGSSVTTAFVNPVEFLSKVKVYKHSVSDNRPRCFPELGYIGAPFDTDGSARTTWIQGIYDELVTWSEATQGWKFLGFIWWNTGGKEGTSLTAAGTKRWFQLDRRHTGTDGSYTTINPAKPLIKFNELTAINETEGNQMTNLLNEANSSFESGVGYWTAGDSNTTIASSVAHAKIGGASLELTAGTSNTGVSTYSAPFGSIAAQVVEGQNLQVTAWFKAGTIGRSCRLDLKFATSSNTILPVTYFGTPFADNASGWVQLAVSGVVPDNAVTAYVIARVGYEGSPPASGEKHYLDAVVMESAINGSYIDGYNQGKADLKADLKAAFPGWVDTV